MPGVFLHIYGGRVSQLPPTTSLFRDSCLHLPCAEVIGGPPYLSSIYIRFWGLNSGPQTCTASSLPVEPFPLEPGVPSLMKPYIKLFFPL